MQKLIETLKEYGIVIPDGKEAELKSALSKNYKNVAEHGKALSKVEADRDEWKAKAEAAEEALQKFDGIDPQKVQDEINVWKQKAENAESEYKKRMEEREKKDLIDAAFADIKFTSESAKRSVVKQIAENVTVKNGKLIGFSDLLDEAKKDDPTAFVDEKTAGLESGKARFSATSNPQEKGGVLTAKEIMSIKDPVERQRKIGENPTLFVKK